MSSLPCDSSVILHPSSLATLPLPAPRCPVSVRVATPGDLPFIDGLQKMHGKMVGWMPTKSLEQKIAAGQVVVAEEATERRSDEATEGENRAEEGAEEGTEEGTERRSDEATEGENAAAGSAFPFVAPSLRRLTPSPLGYAIAHDQYFKRDDVGIIYQLNVLPMRQRNLIGATLLKATFDRAAYGCRLFCCWCAQDIAANRFWESMGFVPLAFRAGSRDRSARGQKGRVHIFWQKRIRPGDTTTPWWFPSRTSAGSIREERLVLPIPPGTHWSDAKPLLLPSVGVLPSRESAEVRVRSAEKKRSSRKTQHSAPSTQHCISSGGLRFHVAGDCVSETAREGKPRESRGSRGAKGKVKNDPKLVAAARELRDRWLEHVNADEGALLPRGKYDVTRALAAVQPAVPAGIPLLQNVA